MRHSLILLALGTLPLTACTADYNLRDGLFPPRLTEAEQATRDQRRGQVEVFVKSYFPQILSDIDAGGGPTLTQAFNLAGVPGADRPTRTTQIRSNVGLYEVNPGALVSALLVYGR